MQSWKREVYKSKEWQRVRSLVIQRDGGVCQICHKLITGRADVDHIIQLTARNYTDPAIAFNPDNLRTLHADCHNRRHGRFMKESIVDSNLEVDYSRRKR
jgi:5-methylcytosine-specific restriction endonuclease McrA